MPADQILLQRWLVHHVRARMIFGEHAKLATLPA